MATFAPGMRVVLAEGPWESGPRTAGHYGKVVQVVPADEERELPPIQVDITGHVDGQLPQDFTEFEWYWPEELMVVD